jgi:hypothetical protein
MQRDPYTANYHQSPISEKPVVDSIAVKGVYEGDSAISFIGRIHRLSLTASCVSAPRSGSRSAAGILAAPAEAPALSPPGGGTSGVARLGFFHCCFSTFDPLAFGDISRWFDSTFFCAAVRRKA